jgi:hypothetical protein
MSHALTRVSTLVTSSVMTILGVAPAHAQSSEPAAAETVARAATPVEIILVGRAGSEGSLAERIRSWFGSDVTLSIARDQALAAERVLGPRATGVGVWVTLRGPNQARLYFAAAVEAEEPTRYLVRDVPLADGLDEIGGERVAQVVHSSVVALIDDSADAIARPELEAALEPPKVQAEPQGEPIEPEPVRAPPPTPDRGPWVTPFAGAFYRAAFGGDEGLAHGPGLALGTTLDFGTYGVGLVTRGQYIFPHTEPFDDLALRLSEFSGRLGPRGYLRAGKVEFDLELGGGIAWVGYDPEGTAFGPLPTSRDTDQRFFWFASAGARHALGLLQLGLRIELELYASRSHYELDSGRHVASSSRYRPALVLELVLD